MGYRTVVLTIYPPAKENIALRITRILVVTATRPPGAASREVSKCRFYTRASIYGNPQHDGGCAEWRKIVSVKLSVYGDSPALPKTEGGRVSCFRPTRSQSVQTRNTESYIKSCTLDTYGLRYSMFSADSRGNSKFIKQLINNERPTTRDGRQSRFYVYRNVPRQSQSVQGPGRRGSGV